MTLQLKRINFLFFILPALLAFFLPVKTNAQTQPDIPSIISRAQWGADESLRTWDPEYQRDDDGYSINKADYIVVHHTASSKLTPDTDGSGRYTSMVKAIYRWHSTNASWEDYSGASSRGFGDIGYHYLIDPNGNIYQGRAGQNGVVGAHAYGHNKGTIGIALIGTYGADINGSFVSHPLTAKAQESLAKLAGWLSAANGINLSNKILIDNQYQYPLVGHKDVRATNCPGNALYSQIEAVRNQASLYSAQYQKYLYQEANSSRVFLIRDGLRRDYDSLQTFQQTGISYSKLVSPNSLVSDLFAQRAFLKYPDGTLLQEIGQPTVYYLQNGQKRPLRVTAIEFEKLGFSWASIIEIDSIDIALYGDGQVVEFAPAGKLIADPEGRVYFTENGKKRWIVSQQLFNHLGFSWSLVKNDLAAENYLSGEVMRYKTGTLVKESGPAVYVIEGSVKRKVTSLQLFNYLGLSWKNLNKISDQELVLYEEGVPMQYRSGALVKQQGGQQVYLILENVKKPFLSAEVFLANGYRWENILELSAEEMAVYATDGYVGYPEGTLLRSQNGNRVFVVKNNVLEWIKSAQQFQSAGYRWSQVKVISDGEFSLLYPGVNPSDLPMTTEPVNNQEPPTQTPPVNTTQNGDLIRIGLQQLENGQQVQVTANGPFSRYDESGNKIESFNAGQVATVLAQAGNFAKFNADNNNTILEVLSYEDRPAWKPSLNYNRFRNSVEVKYSDYSNSFWLVNELPMEWYLWGIGEALNADDPQYQKAFAIMTRSYATFHLQNDGKRAGEIFHLNNTSSDQVYKGYTFETIAENLVEAVKETQGIVMKYNGQIARAVYSSDSGGTTVSACQKWGGSFCDDSNNYLDGGIKDPEGTQHNQAKIDASHGVGVSTTGARRLAELGYGYEQILKYYYLGIELEKIY